MIDDDGPSREDLERFGGDTAYCPECGAEIYDASEACPSCGVWIRGGTRSRKPLQHATWRRWVVVVAILTLIGFLVLVGVLRL